MLVMILRMMMMLSRLIRGALSHLRSIAMLFIFAVLAF